MTDEIAEVNTLQLKPYNRIRSGISKQLLKLTGDAMLSIFYHSSRGDMQDREISMIALYFEYVTRKTMAPAYDEV